MEQESVITRNLQGWKIRLAVAIGIAVAVLMLYSALNQSQFVKVKDGTGEYVLKDSVKKIDLSNEEIFLAQANGNYSKLDVTDALKEINWDASSYFYFALAILLMVGRDFFYIVRIRLLTNNELTWKASFYVILLWEFASALTPGIVGGAAVAMFILNKEKIPLGRSTAIVFITAMMDNLFYVIMIPIIFLFITPSELFPSQIESSRSMEWIFWIGFFVVFGAFLFLFLSIFIWPKLGTRFLSAVFSLPFIRRWKDKAIQTGSEIELTSKEMRKEKWGFWLKIFASTIASWFSRFLVINMILQAFIGFGFLEHIQILGKQLVMWLFMLVSPTPGGSGVAEYAFSELLSNFTSSAILLVALAIIWRLISYFPYLFIGAVLLPRWMKRN